MADRKKTPNILGDLLGGSIPTETPASQPDPKPENPQDDLPAKPQVVKTEKPSAGSAAKPKNNTTEKTKAVKPTKSQAVLPAKQEVIKVASTQDDEVEEEPEEEAAAKIKVTFYLSEDAVEFLEDSQSRLRKLNRTAGRKRGKAFTSKSAILEEAVRLVCTELEEKGMDSQLARVLL